MNNWKVEVMVYRPLVLTEEKGWIAGKDTSLYGTAISNLLRLKEKVNEMGLTIKKRLRKTWSLRSTKKKVLGKNPRTFL